MRALVLASVAACSDPFTFHATMRWEGSGPGVIRVNGVAIETSAVERNYASYDDALAAAPLALTVDNIAAPVDMQPGSACQQHCNGEQGFVDETDTWALTAASGELFLDALSGACTSPSSTCTWTP